MQNSYFKIIPLKDHQLKEASLVVKKCWQETYKGIFPPDQLAKLDERVWQQAMGRTGRHNLIALVENKIVGLISYGVPRQIGKFPKDCGELMSIYVLTKYHGKGIGTALMQEAMQGLIRLGYSHAALWVEEKNQSAIKFYKRKGWQKTGKYQKQIILGQKVNLLQYQK